MAWHHLQYVLGFLLLGHEVTFIEDSGDFASCYDPELRGMTTDPSYGLRFATQAFDRLHLPQTWAYYDEHRDEWLGPGASTARERCQTADIVMNVSGVNPIREWTSIPPIRVLIDTDPGFTQVRHLTDAGRLGDAARHSAFASFGERIGEDGCTIPNDGIAWIPTRQPITPDAWRVAEIPTAARFTTVMSWEAYPDLEFRGRRFGTKSSSFEPYIDLPQVASVPLELAVGGASAPRTRLRAAGWHVTDPASVARDPWIYQRYIRGSAGEFTVAKEAYVTTASGWFSERSAAYLASGRAVVTQDTAFSEILPTGLGLLAFSTRDEALAGLEDVASNPQRHGSAARELAREYFDSSRVLTHLLDRVARS